MLPTAEEYIYFDDNPELLDAATELKYVTCRLVFPGEEFLHGFRAEREEKYRDILEERARSLAKKLLPYIKHIKDKETKEKLTAFRKMLLSNGNFNTNFELLKNGIEKWEEKEERNKWVQEWDNPEEKTFADIIQDWKKQYGNPSITEFLIEYCKTFCSTKIERKVNYNPKFFDNNKMEASTTGAEKDTESKMLTVDITYI